MGSLAEKTILVIEDEGQMRHLISTVLKKEDAVVYTAADGVEGLRALYEVKPDLVLLDVMMPRMDGWDVLRRIRRMTDTPVIMLTVLKGTENEVRALHDGANDFISKPFELETLLARVETALRYVPANDDSDVFDDGYLVVDRWRRQVRVGGEAVHLTRKEFELLEFLIGQEGRVCTYELILDNIWGGVSQSTAENVHVFTWQLRQKIEPDPRNPVYIVNVPSVGYAFGGKQSNPIKSRHHSRRDIS